MELLKGDVKLTETVNFCETIEESEGEEGKDSSPDSSVEISSKNKVIDLFDKKNKISALNDSHKSAGRNGINMKRFYTLH